VAAWLFGERSTTRSRTLVPRLTSGWSQFWSHSPAFTLVRRRPGLPTRRGFGRSWTMLNTRSQISEAREGSALTPMRHRRPTMIVSSKFGPARSDTCRKTTADVGGVCAGQDCALPEVDRFRSRRRFLGIRHGSGARCPWVVSSRVAQRRSL